MARADRRPRRLHVAILVAVALAVTSSAALLARARDGPQQVRIGSGDIGFVDGSSGRLTRVVPAAGHGGPLAVAGGTAWAADQASKTVTSVDLAHGATQPYGLGIPPTAVAAAGGSVWIAGGFAGTLSRILPAGRFIGAPFRPTPTSTGRLALALDGRTLWVAGQDRRLVALDTGSLRVRRTVELPAGPRAIAAAAGAVWAVVYGDTRIVRIDAATGALRRGAELGHQPVALHAGRGGVWVATRGDNRVWRIDARTGHPVAAVPVGEQPTSLAVSAGSLWVGGIGGTVARIDPRSTALVGTVRLGVPIAGLAAGTGGVWVSVR